MCIIIISCGEVWHRGNTVSKVCYIFNVYYYSTFHVTLGNVWLSGIQSVLFSFLMCGFITRCACIMIFGEKSLSLIGDVMGISIQIIDLDTGDDGSRVCVCVCVCVWGGGGSSS